MLLALALAFSACSDSTGVASSELRVSFDLRGNTTDPDGVGMWLRARGGDEVLAKAQAAIETGAAFSAPPGAYTLSVGDLAANCWLEGEEEIAVVISEGGPTPVSIEVTCIGDFAYVGAGWIRYVGTEGVDQERDYGAPLRAGSWNPSGSSILVREITRPGLPLTTFDVSTGQAWKVGRSGFAYAGVLSPLWSPAGDRLVVDRADEGSDRHRTVVMFDERGTTPLDSIVDLGAWAWSWRPGTEDLTYSNGEEIRFYSWGDRTDSHFLTLPARGLAWSPDGTRLAVVTDAGPGRSIVIVDADGHELFTIGGAGRDVHGPTWSPEGSGILFQSSRHDGQPDQTIRYVTADGSVERAVASGFDPSWAASGDYFLYTALHDDLYRVFLGNVHGLTSRELVPGRSARFRPTAHLRLDSGR